MCFFFNDTATTEIYTLSLHDALPIFLHQAPVVQHPLLGRWDVLLVEEGAKGEDQVNELVNLRHEPHEPIPRVQRSEEHTSELQSRQYLVCRLLLEKKKNKTHAARIMA